SHPLHMQMADVRALAGMFEGDGAHVAFRIQVEERVLVQVARLNDLPALELDVQGIGVLEVLNFHGLKPRSKNASWTVISSGSSSRRYYYRPAEHRRAARRWHVRRGVL